MSARVCLACCACVRVWGASSSAAHAHPAGACNPQTPTQRHTATHQQTTNATKRLVDSEPKKLYCALPVLYVTGVLAKDRRRAQTYDAPCYRSKARTGRNFVTTFSLRTEEDRSKWTLCGVALLCSID